MNLHSYAMLKMMYSYLQVALFSIKLQFVCLQESQAAYIFDFQMNVHICPTGAAH